MLNEYKNIKILHIIGSFQAGGAERVALNLVNMLDEIGFDISLLVFNGEGELQSLVHSSIKTINLNRKKKFSINKIYRLAKIMQKYDMVHIHGRYVYRYVAFVKMLFGLKCIMIMHDHSSDRSQGFKNSIYKYLLKFSNSYIGTSQEICRWAKVTLEYPENSVYLLANTIIKDKNIKYLQKKDDIFKIILISNFRRVKNIEFAIHLFKSIKLVYPNAQLHIYGQIVEENYFYELENLVSKIKLKSSVFFITNCSYIQKKLFLYDIAIHTAKRETGPLVLIEYLAYGIPFLSFDTGDVAQVVKKRYPFMFRKDFDLKNWEKSFFNILKNFEIENKKENLIKIYEQEFSVERYKKLCIEIYRKNLNFL